MSFEYEFEDIEYDTGYGVESGILIVECEPILESTDFEAYNEAGTLSTYSEGLGVDGVEVLNATLFLIGNNGVELGEITFTQADLFKLYPNIEDDLIERLIQEEL